MSGVDFPPGLKRPPPASWSGWDVETDYISPPPLSMDWDSPGMTDASKGLHPADVDPGAGWGKFASYMQIAGSIISIMDSIHGARMQKEALKEQASALKHKAWMANFNARRAEEFADGIMGDARHAFGRISQEYEQFKETQKTRTAKRGVVVGVGSSQELLATVDISKEVDKITINRNALRKAAAVRMGAVNQRNEALMANVGAGNMRRNAGAISSFGAALGPTMQGIGQYAAMKARNTRGSGYSQTGVS